MADNAAYLLWELHRVHQSKRTFHNAEAVQLLN